LLEKFPTVPGFLPIEAFPQGWIGVGRGETIGETQRIGVTESESGPPGEAKPFEKGKKQPPAPGHGNKALD
jgi:hypothetical protein